jgi:multidrug efflux pump subunit AcrB
VPQLFLNIDREKVQTLNVPISSVFTTLQSYLGSNYVNDFNHFALLLVR